MSEIVLVIDARDELAREVERALPSLTDTSPDIAVHHVHDAGEALARLDWGRVDLVVSDAEAAGLDGFDLVPQIRRRLPGASIVLAAARSSAELAEEALERGAYDTLTRPIDASCLALLMRRVRDRQRALRKGSLLQRELRRAAGTHSVVAASESMIAALEAVERCAAQEGPALVVGEPGSGRETAARAVHGQSERRDGPFVVLSCVGFSERHLESELFGRMRGDFAGGAPARRGLLTEASSGSLYIDEIGALPPTLQTRLLAALESGEFQVPDHEHRISFDVRFLASTQYDLERRVKAGRFDAGLLQHFAPSVIQVPALRDRREDVPLLVDDFLAHLRDRHGRKVRGLTDAALERVAAYPWPGNLAELENALERAVLLTENEQIDAIDLPEIVIASSEASSKDAYALRPARHAAETVVIKRALRATSGNRTHAARLLGISQRALLYKIKDFGITD